MHDLWPRVVEETNTKKPLELCAWQRWEITQTNHNFECDYKSCFTLIFIKERYHIRKYKRYLDGSSVLEPKSTKLDRNKRSGTCSNKAISIPQSVVSTELIAMVPTELSASRKGETFVQETEATICDYRGALELGSTNGYALCEAFPSLKRGVENWDTRLSFDWSILY